MDLGLKGAAVCVSGGTKGLGREAALAFAREGARVVVSGRGAEALTCTVEMLRDAGSPDAFGRVALPEELASLLLLLGSRANSYIVGANIPVDGGTDFSTG